jgi:hypothetical protein
MRAVFAFGLVLAAAGVVEAADPKGLRVRVVDAVTGKPVPGATVERWASQWQPRILALPAKFWFPAGKGVAADADGYAALEKTAGDDRYYVRADGYEQGFVVRRGSKFELADGQDGKPRPLAPEGGVLVVPLRPRDPGP